MSMRSFNPTPPAKFSPYEVSTTKEDDYDNDALINEELYRMDYEKAAMSMSSFNPTPPAKFSSSNVAKPKEVYEEKPAKPMSMSKRMRTKLSPLPHNITKSKQVLPPITPTSSLPGLHSHTMGLTIPGKALMPTSGSFGQEPSEDFDSDEVLMSDEMANWDDKPEAVTQSLDQAKMVQYNGCDINNLNVKFDDEESDDNISMDQKYLDTGKSAMSISPLNQTAKFSVYNVATPKEVDSDNDALINEELDMMDHENSGKSMSSFIPTPSTSFSASPVAEPLVYDDWRSGRACTFNASGAGSILIVVSLSKALHSNAPVQWFYGHMWL